MILVTKNLRIGYFTKSLPWETRIGIPINISKEVAIILRGLRVFLVESNIWVSVLLERMVVLSLVVRDTR